MQQKPLTAQYDALELWIRIIIQVFAGSLVGGIYRIIRYTETKNITTLIVGIVITFTGIGNFAAWIIDLITLATEGRYTLFVD
ncbi:MAG: hypothetical protein J6Q68_00440 [Clostridia bacterium]|nr:hypothetical protein [Clostridia bacterium]